MIGTQILHYKIQKKLGEGGMGKVYLALDLELERQVALKVLSPEKVSDPESRHRFLHEAKAQAMLNHPNIATFYEVAEHGDTVFIAMEYIEGEPLSRSLRGRELAPTEVLDLAIQVGDALQAAHEHGIVHRDIKPDNIMVTPKAFVKITDFGLARWKGATTLTQKGARLGSAYYMSPEQAEGQRVDHRSDIFSLGVVLYELLCRRRPFEGDSEAVVLYELINTQPQPPARYCRDVPAELEWIVMKCLARTPAERYQSAADLVADLRRVKHEIDSGHALPHSDLVYVRRPRRRWRFGLAVSGVALAAALLLLAVPSLRQTVWRQLGLLPSRSELYLVVVPFKYLGSGAPNEAFTDGLLETLASKLTQMEEAGRSLRVIPACDVRRLGVASVREAREAFGATHAVTGSIQHLTDVVRVTVNLVDAGEEIQLNSDVIDDSPANISGLQDSIVLSLAAMLTLDLDPDRLRTLTAGGTAVAPAYELCVQGRGYLQRHAEQVGTRTLVDIYQLDTAIALFSGALAHDPRYAQAHAGLAFACWSKNRALAEPQWIDSAIDHALQAIELDDRLTSGYVSLATIHSGIGRYGEAVHEFKQALTIDPGHQEAYHGLARTYELQNKLDLAEETHRELIERKPDHLDGYYQLELFYLEHGRFEDAARQMQTVLALEPQGFVHLNRVGAMYFFLGEWDKARGMWERSLAVATNYVACSNLGTVHFMNQRYAEAATMYEQALAVDDRDYRIWVNLGSVYRQMPQHEESVTTTYRRAIELAERERRVNPRDPPVLAHLAECYVVVYDTLRALALARKAVAMAPEQVDVVVRAGLVYEQIGRRDSAVALIGKALSLGFPRQQLEAVPEAVALMTDPRLAEPDPEGEDSGRH